MPSGWGMHSIKMTDVSQHQARVSATGLIIAKYVEMYEGNKEPIFESINSLMEGDADLIGGVVLTLLNLFVMFLSDNGNNAEQFKEVCDYLINSLADDTPQISRMLN